MFFFRAFRGGNFPPSSFEFPPQTITNFICFLDILHIFSPHKSNFPPKTTSLEKNPDSKLHQCLSVCELAPVAGHFIPLYWVLLFELTYCYAGSILLLLDAELRLQQPSKTSGFYSTDRAMKLSYSLTHLRSYVDCIASIFIIKYSDHLLTKRP